jgi:hypothetical protein
VCAVCAVCAVCRVPCAVVCSVQWRAVVQSPSLRLTQFAMSETDDSTGGGGVAPGGGATVRARRAARAAAAAAAAAAGTTATTSASTTTTSPSVTDVTPTPAAEADALVRQLDSGEATPYEVQQRLMSRTNRCVRRRTARSLTPHQRYTNNNTHPAPPPETASRATLLATLFSSKSSPPPC